MVMLSFVSSHAAVGLMQFEGDVQFEAIESGRALPHSKTLSRNRERLGHKRFVWREPQAGYEFVQFAGFEAAEANDVPEVIADIAGEAIAAFRIEDDPTFRQWHQCSQEIEGVQPVELNGAVAQRDKEMAWRGAEGQRDNSTRNRNGLDELTRRHIPLS